MSLARTALRVAAVMAIANGFRAPWPTMAQGRVFDSRMDPHQIVDQTDVIPIVEICTDDGRGASLSENNGGPPFENTVTLAIEMSLGMMGEVEDGTGRYLGLPQSEPELEAMLDLLELQVQRALVDPSNPWTAEFQRVCRRMSDWSSTRYVERDSNVRMAARKVSAEVALQFEELTEIQAVPPAPVAVPSPLGPLLAAIIADGGPFAVSATSLRDLLIDAGASRPVTLPALRVVRFIEADQAETNGAGTPRGPRPDGVAEIDFNGG